MLLTSFEIHCREKRSVSKRRLRMPWKWPRSAPLTKMPIPTRVLLKSSFLTKTPILCLLSNGILVSDQFLRNIKLFDPLTVCWKLFYGTQFADLNFSLDSRNIILGVCWLAPMHFPNFRKKSLDFSKIWIFFSGHTPTFLKKVGQSSDIRCVSQIYSYWRYLTLNSFFSWHSFMFPLLFCPN